MPVSPMKSTVAELSLTFESSVRTPFISREAVTTRSMPALGLSLSRSSRFSARSSDRCASTIATAALFARTASRFMSRCLNGPSRLSLSRSTNTSPTDCEGKLSGTQTSEPTPSSAPATAVPKRGSAATRLENTGPLSASRAPTASSSARRMRRARSRPRPCWATTSSRTPPLENATNPRSPPAFSTASLTVWASSPSMSEVSRNRRLASSRARNSLLVESETATYWRSISRRSASARSPDGEPASSSHSSACSSSPRAWS